jgi:hypothetical protein
MADNTQAQDTRATVEYKLKSGNHTVTLKEYLTGREKRAVKNALWTGKSMKIKDGKGESDPVPMEDIDASTNRTIELMVVAIDGKTDNILDRVLDMRDRDYDDVLEKIEELTGPIDDSKKEAGPKNTQS